jgi:hypothetical protein
MRLGQLRVSLILKSSISIKVLKEAKKMVKKMTHLTKTKAKKGC